MRVHSTYFFLLGITFQEVKHVKSQEYYTKEVTFKGQRNVVEIYIKETRRKEFVERKWQNYILVCLDLVDTEGNSIKLEPSAEDVLDRLELLRDCWLQLAAGL